MHGQILKEHDHMSLIELENIYFGYEEGEPVLEDLSFSVDKGTCLVITGDNGSGKTTILRILNGLSFPDRGTYRFKGTDINREHLKDNRNSKRFHKDIGYLFQNPDTMLFNSRVYDEIAFGPRQMGLTDSETDERVNDLLKLFGIEALKDKVPYHLSGGQKKWVALASVMALDPEVLIMDEPFAGLDRKRQTWLIEFLKELREAGKTLMIATHSDELAGDLADKVLEL